MSDCKLQPIGDDEVRIWTDHAMLARGILVAFTERRGGVSAPPFSSLDLAGHVGDDPGLVDGNRDRVLAALSIDALRDRLVTATQVHGDHIEVVGEADAGRGAFLLGEDSRPASAPFADTDALLVSHADIPLMLFFADCVPIVLAAPEAPAVGVVHAGWRGALAGLPGKAAARMAHEWGVPSSEIVAYIGPHVCPKCYAVGAELLSQFVHAFVTVAPGEGGGLDLSAAVRESLTGAGVLPTKICSLDACTAEATDRFFSYRAEGGVTGRHAALACILGEAR